MSNLRIRCIKCKGSGRLESEDLGLMEGLYKEDEHSLEWVRQIEREKRLY